MVNRSSVEAAIAEFEDFMGGRWTVPREPAIEFITGFYTEVNLLIISDANARYLGRHDTPADLARSLAVESFPPTDRPELGTGIDWQAWPFNHIDWAEAGRELILSVGTGSVRMYGAGHYFSAVAPTQDG